MFRKFTGTVAGATIFLIIVSIFSKGIGFIREILFASRFGTTEAYDLYLIAAIFPITINTSLYYISQNYFIPLYNKVVVAGDDRLAFVGRNFWLFVMWGILISVLLIIFSNPLLNAYIGSSFSKNRELIRNIFNLIVLSIPLGAGIAILSSYVNAEFEFRIPAYSILLFNIVLVIVVFIFSRNVLIYSIPIGYLAGSVLQLLFLLIYIKFVKKVSLGLKRNFKISMKIDSVIISVIAIEIIGQLYMVIDRWFYPSVDPGGMSALNYAINLFSMPVSLISVSFAAVLFPFLTRTINTENEKNYLSKVKDALKVNNLIFIPLFIILFFFGDIVIQLFFERGKFNREDTIMTYEILKALSLGLIFYSGYSILNKSLFAAQKINFLLIVTISAVILKIILSYILIENYKQNGLALSTAIVYIFFFICSMIAVLKSFKNILEVFLHLIFNLIIAIFILLIIKIIMPVFNPGILLANIFLICIFCVLYILTTIILDYNFIRKLNPNNRSV